MRKTKAPWQKKKIQEELEALQIGLGKNSRITAAKLNRASGVQETSSTAESTEYDTTKTYSGLEAPASWHIIERRDDGIMWQRLNGEAIKVIESTSIEADGRTWLHVSVSKPSRKMPTYDDVQTVRKLFVGNRECYQVFPTEDRYVNYNPVLHLWCCLDAPEGVLPHFEGLINGKVSV